MKSKTVSIFICVMMVAGVLEVMEENGGQVSPSSNGTGGLADTPWPMFRGNVRHTGLSPYDTSANTDQLKWSFTTGSYVISSPAIDSDGTIYVGSNDHKLYAINPDGTEKWSFLTGGEIGSSPALGSDGTIYVGSNDHKLYAINPDGTQKWSFTTTGGGGQSSPVIDSEGTIYIGSNGNKVYAINPDGTQKWSFTTSGEGIHSSPAIDSEGTIYVGSHDYKLYAINPDGTQKWSFTTGNEVDSSPAIGFDGTIYVGSVDHELYAINPDGSEKWSFTTLYEIHSSPAISSDGTIYVGSRANRLYAINPDGTEKWNFMTDGSVYSSPAIGSDGTIYVGSDDYKLYAINPDGTEKWNFMTGDAVRPSPAIGADGTIYIGSYDNNLYAIGGITHPWPMFRHNPKNTGLSPYDTSRNDGSLKWSFTTGGFVSSSPAIGSDGTIYVGSVDHKLYAINRDGTEKWSFITGDAVRSSPAIGADGTIYIGSVDHKLYAINRDGTEKWSFMADDSVRSSPAIGADGTIYVGSEDTKLYAINPDGTEKWNYQMDSNVQSSPAIGSDGTIYVGSWLDKVYAINPNGTEKWNFTTTIHIISSPTIGPDGTIYVGSYDSKLYAIFPDGSQKWTFTTGNQLLSSPAIGPDGTIYIGSFDKKLYAINPDGTEKWSFITGDYLYSSPAIGSDGTIYIGSWDSKLYAINPDGTEKWNFTTGDRISSSPAIDSDGTIYIGSSNHNLYAIGTPTQNQLPVADASPDQTVNEGEEVQFDGSASYDPDGTIVSYEWDFESDGTYDYQETPTSAPDGAFDGMTTHTYGDDGIYTTTLRITDEDSESDTDTCYITVNNVAPAITLIRTYPDHEGSRVTYEAEASDLGSDDLTFSWEIEYGPNIENTFYNNWIDPEPVYDPAINEIKSPLGTYPFSISDVVTHIYGDDYEYTVSLTVTDDDGGETTSTSTVSVFNSAPFLIEFNVPSDLEEGLSTIYEALSSDHGSDDLTFTWEFELGPTITNVQYNDGVNPDPYPSPWGTYPFDISNAVYHTYGDNGVYSVSLTVEDDDGGVTSYSTDITVRNRAPVIDSVTAPGGDEGTPLTFSATASDLGSDDLTFTWDWGDGTTDIVTNYYNDGTNPEHVYDPITNEIKSPWGTYPFTTTDTISHTYGDDGVYTITLTVEDDDGGAKTSVTSVLINNVEPTIDTIIGPGTAGGSGDITEEWVARYNGPGNSEDHPRDIAVDSSGDIYVTGLSLSTYREYDYTTIKYDAEGNELWLGIYDGPTHDSDLARALAIDSSQNVYVTGTSYGGDQTQGGSEGDYATIKYDSLGNELWVARYNSPENEWDYGHDIAVALNGNVYVTGQSSGGNPDQGGTSYDYATVAYDSSGHELWIARYNGPGNDGDYSSAITVDSSGNVYVTGNSIGVATNRDVATVKYDINGNEIWVSRYNGPGNGEDVAYSIALDSSENIYVTGFSDGSGTSRDFVTIKYDSDGNELWVARYNGPANNEDFARSIVVDPSDNIFVTGNSKGSETNFDYTTVKYDPNGNEIWVVRYDGPANGYDVPYGLVLDSKGNIYVTGKCYGLTGEGKTDYATVKYDSNGNEIWVATYNGPGNHRDEANSIAVDLSDNVYVTGASMGEETDFDYCTIKYPTSTHYECEEGSVATFTATASDPGSDDLSFTWDWGDGTTDSVSTYYNDGANPEPDYDPSSNEIKSPLGTYPFTATDTVSHIYGDDGEYTITLTVEDDDGGITTHTMIIIVNNVAPVIDSINSPAGNEGSQITFSSTVTDLGSDDLTFMWDWGDGTSSTTNIYYNDGNNPDPYPSPLGTYPFSVADTVQHTYGDDGVYTITLTVTDDDGGSTVITTDVGVNNVAPTITVVITPSGDEGSSLTFEVEAMDPGTDDLTFSWEFEYGPTIENTYYNNGVSPEPVYDPNTNEIKSPGGTFPFSSSDMVTHIYGDNYIYTLIITVTDDDGGTTTYTTTIDVENLAPSFTEIIIPLNVDEGTQATYSVTASDQGSDDLTFTWEFELGSTVTTTYYNDGSSPDPEPSPWGTFPFSASDTVDYTYGDNGVYTVTLTVSDDDGGITTYTTDVTINNVAPTIDSVTVPGGDEGVELTFSSRATDQGSDDLTFTWDWGDGISDTVTIYYNDGTGPDPSPSPWGTYPFTATDTVQHTYCDNGVYTITLTVEDDDGDSSIYTRDVTIENVAPIIDSVVVSGGDEGAKISYSSTATDQGSDDLTFTWDWGDGASDTVTVYYNDGTGPDPYPSPWGTYPFTATDTVSHTYGDNGVYTIILTVEDDDSGSTIYTKDITIENVVPTMDSISAPGGDEGSILTYISTATDLGSDDLTFTWDWGDGTSDTVSVHYNDGVGPDPYPSPWGIYPYSATDNVQHTYGDNGIYTITLTIEDDDSGATTHITNVEILNVAPTINPFGPFSVEEGSSLDISAISTDPGSDDLTFTWEFELGPTITDVYYNDGLSPDPFPSPWGIFPFSITDTESHIYGDDGVFTLTLTVEDDDNGVSSYETNITVDNVDPTIVNLEAYIYVNFTLHVAGEKYHSVGMHLMKEGENIASAFVTRIPGNPDEQTGTIVGAKIDVTKQYTILVDYLPNDPRINGNVWGANPVWIIMTFEDGSETRLHHTFNVRKSYWNDDHWNHIDPWEVELNPLLVGHNITFEASVEDPGSDDLTFTWEWRDGTTNTEITYYNDGSGPDPYPSPWGIYPFTATDVQKHIFSFTGNYIVTLTVKDDDGGITTMSLDIVL